MSAPLVSVVIPVFDRARFLGEAIESVRAQTYQPVELIVVDDGSTDGSADVAEAHGARVIRQPRRGVSAARNAGIEAAAGEYLAFLDSDDLWPADRLALQVAHLERHPELDFVLAYAMMVVVSGSPDWLTEEWLAGVQTVKLPGVPPAAPGTAGPVPCGLTVLARAALFERIGGYDTSYDLGEDTELLLRAVDSGADYEMLPHVVLNYRVHGTNASHRAVTEGGAVMLRLARASLARKRAPA